MSGRNQNHRSPRHTDVMALRIGIVLSCVALASPMSGCAAEKSGEGTEAPQAQVNVEGAEQSTERRPSPSTTEPTLRGTWAVRALVGSQGESVLGGPYARKLEMTFTDGEMSGNSGCNTIFGPYEQNGQDLTFPPRRLGSTLVGCDEPPLLRRLLDVRHLSGSGDVRYLHADNWMIVAELHRP